VINGFHRGYKPITGVDGAHLKGSFGGVLLTTIAIYAANACFPCAVAVVESKNNDS